LVRRKLLVEFLIPSSDVLLVFCDGHRGIVLYSCHEFSQSSILRGAKRNYIGIVPKTGSSGARRSMPEGSISALVSILGAVLVALAAIFIFWRSRSLQTVEKRLSEFYSPLYFHVAKVSEPREFWRSISKEDWRTQVYPVLIRNNYLASDRLLDFLRASGFDEKGAPQSDDFSREFVNIVLEDYTRLREEYLRTRRWFLPLRDP
jgi:hypothetical protein